TAVPILSSTATPRFTRSMPLLYVVCADNTVVASASAHAHPSPRTGRPLTAVSPAPSPNGVTAGRPGAPSPTLQSVFQRTCPCGPQRIHPHVAPQQIEDEWMGRSRYNQSSYNGRLGGDAGPSS